MSAFGLAIGTIFEHEGGLVNDPRDRGGKTFRGLSQASYPDLDLDHITDPQAAAVYQRDWWNGFGGIDNQLVGTKVFDMAVLEGHGVAVKALQVACTACGLTVPPTGFLGPLTLKATNTLGAAVLPAWLRATEQHFRDIVSRVPADAAFEKGWFNRVEDMTLYPAPPSLAAWLAGIAQVSVPVAQLVNPPDAITAQLAGAGSAAGSVDAETPWWRVVLDAVLEKLQGGR